MSSAGEFYSSSPPEVVIAVDFGTTFSGFAYAKISDQLQPLEILDNCKWPEDSKAGAKPYCKNQTSLFYTPNPTKPGHFELQDWGWSAFHAFTKAARRSHTNVSIKASPKSKWSAGSSSSSSMDQGFGDALNIGAGNMANQVGFFAHKFKLYLAPEERMKNNSLPLLPGDLTAERLVVDYLQKLSEFIMEELRVATRKGFSMEEVQWCLTVPAIWDEKAKQAMRTCAEKAGMVKGAKCPCGVSASPRALHIILEPEAASVYCQQKTASLNLAEGDSILVADVGGGTIDLVVHEIVERHPTKGITKVREAVASYGETGGGTFVDANFFDLLCQKIGCFKEFCRDKNPSLSTFIYSWWQGIKTDFDGPGYTAELSLANSALGEAWEKHDREHGITRADDYYSEFCLDDKEIMSIFDPEVDKVLQLIEKHIETVRVLMVVGGFATSLYLRKRIMSKFKERVEEIIIPENPGGAICKGAVQLHMSKGYVESRISKKTYGICSTRDAEDGDPPELIEVDDDGQKMCTHVFSPFVRAGESVRMDASEQQCYTPVFHNQDFIYFPVYSSPRVYPKFTTEDDAKEEGSFIVDISKDMALGKEREVQITMVFGDSLITVAATRLNFGNQRKEEGLSVTFDHT